MSLNQQFSEVMKMPVGKFKRVLKNFIKIKEEERNRMDEEHANINKQMQKNNKRDNRQRR